MSAFTLPALATDCHAHIFDPARFPYAAGRRYTPPSATVDDLLSMHDRLGVQRVVLVQPSVYATDNRCLLAALGRLGSLARGVAVIDRTFTSTRLEDLYAGGVRGVRINLEVSKQANASEAVERLRETVEILGAVPLFIQVYAALPVIVSCAPALRALRQHVLIDHFGLAQATGGTSQPGFTELTALMAASNIWMKLSGPYQISDQSPGYLDIEPISKAMLAASPDRIVWGSDWPHTGGFNRLADYEPTDIEPFRSEDDEHVLSLVKDWAPQAAARQLVLVDNPARLFGFSDSRVLP